MNDLKWCDDWYVEINDGDLVLGDEYDIIWEADLDCFIEWEQMRDFYREEDFDDLRMYRHVETETEFKGILGIK